MKKMLLCACVVAAFSATHAEVTTINGWQLNIEDGSLNSITTAGEQSLDLSSTTITNLSPSAFDVTSGPKLSQITLPASLQSMKSAPQVLIDDTYTGVDGGANNAGQVKTFSNGTIPAGEAFRAIFDFKFTKDSDKIGDYGSAILATGGNPTQDSYNRGFQLWLTTEKNGGQLYYKANNISTNTTLYDASNLLNSTGFKIVMTYNPKVEQATFEITPDGGETTIVTKDMTIGEISTLSTNVRAAVTMDIKFETIPVNADPFTFCSNLESIKVAEGNEVFSVDEKGYLKDGETIISVPRTPLYNKPVQLIFPNGNMMEFNCVLSSQGQPNENNRKVSITSYTIDEMANHAVNETLFGLVTTQQGIKISALSSVGYGTTGQNNDGKGAWLTYDGTGNNAYVTYNSVWSCIYYMTVAGGTEVPEFYVMAYKAGSKNDNYSYNGYLSVNGNNLVYNANPIRVYISPVTEIPVAVTEEACAMLCLPVAVSAVDGCFTVNDVKDGVAQLLAVTGTIPAATPFMIKGENTVKLSVIDANEPAAEDDASSTDANTPAPILKGCTASMPLSADAWMVNTASGSATTFAKETTPTIAAGSVYLQPEVDETWPDEISLAEKIATSISEITAPVKAFDAVYDIRGRRLVAPGRGINIINGRKVIVK